MPSPPAVAPDRRRLGAAEAFVRIGFALGALVAAVALALRDPAAMGLPPCPFRHLTGFACPGCGTLRATHDLLHGDLIAALDHNLLSTILLPAVALGLARDALAALGKGRPPGLGIRPRWIWTLVAVVVLFGVLRNVPAWPFALLAP